VQVAALALFTGQDQQAREVIEANRQTWIAGQIEPNGRQPATPIEAERRGELVGGSRPPRPTPVARVTLE